MRALLFGLGASSLAAWGWLVHRQRWTPDFEAYTQGGIGFYPSPLGRLLGSLGPTPFVLASLLAAGLTVGLIAHRSWRAALVTAASPIPMYLSFVSADTIALSLYTLFLVRCKPALMLTLATLTHFALVPYTIFHVVTTTRLSRLHKIVLGYFIIGASSIALVSTPYAGILMTTLRRDFFAAFAFGLLLAGLLSLPVLVFYSLTKYHFVAFFIGALECGVQNHAQARYFLPAVVLVLLTATARRLPAISGSPATASSRGGFTNSRRSRAIATGDSS